jgi:hypothetical protein
MPHRNRVAHATPLIATLLLLAAGQALAQSAQRFSLHASALRISFSGDGYAGTGAGLGFEVQGRYRLPFISVGLGFQLTRHKSFGATGTSQFTGFFIDPRYVLPVRSTSFGPYLGARFAILKQRVNYGAVTLTTSGVAFGPGGGVLFRLNRRLNLDVGFTYNYASFGTGQVNGKAIPGSKVGGGTSLVARAGLSYGFGR